MCSYASYIFVFWPPKSTPTIFWWYKKWFHTVHFTRTVNPDNSSVVGKHLRTYQRETEHRYPSCCGEMLGQMLSTSVRVFPLPPTSAARRWWMPPLLLLQLPTQEVPRRLGDTAAATDSKLYRLRGCGRTAPASAARCVNEHTPSHTRSWARALPAMGHWDTCLPRLPTIYFSASLWRYTKHDNLLCHMSSGFCV